ncbi:uncharacterized protein VTP21DRAFT_4703 [Calcarisporiella thermophila]|uniref:uncharacterized protein n=1 Tax=Calcarisporiella thermophila TaxID=911321 RepID=UPI0037421AE2
MVARHSLDSCGPSTSARTTSDSKPRIISVTHQVPYNCVLQNGISERSSASVPTQPPAPGGSGKLDSSPLLQLEKPKWRLTTRRGHSALYAGVRSLQESSGEWGESIHVGWVGQCTNELGEALESAKLHQPYRESLRERLWEEKVVPVFLEDKISAGHYEGYCKTVLWPLLHYLVWDTAMDARKQSLYWGDYVAVNKKFAQAISEIYQPEDIIWVHDYHLMLLPQLLRGLIPAAIIGYFHHAPFCSSEIFRCLPKREDILQGILGSNQVGFQTYSYARHFMSSCTRVLGYDTTPLGVDAKGHLVVVQTSPIGIDAERVDAWRKAPGVAPKVKAIREMYAGKKIIVARDKLDVVKGVKQKLTAFEKFLEDFPEWRGKVVLIQVTSPGVRESVKLEHKISELVSSINSTYGSLEFTPVHHYHQHIDRDEYYALLTVADVALITSIRDGMNTTSLEYIICQKEGHGPLILSEFTGTAGSLAAAIQVNPWDYSMVANAINESLKIPADEKIIKHEQLYNHVSSHTAKYWATSFIRQLIANAGTPDQGYLTPLLDVELLIEKYRATSKRLLLFDYDGTLTPIVKQPHLATPSEKMLRALQQLCDDPHNVVWVISGRDQKTLMEWLGGVRNLGLSAEHGCFLKNPGVDRWINLTEQIDMSWQNEVNAIFNYYTERTQGSFVEHKICSIAWHYRMADPAYGEFQAKECQNHLRQAIVSKLPVDILVGKKNLEVRPISINKGGVVQRLLAAHSSLDFVMCAGDDKTDEDMFRAIKNAGKLRGVEEEQYHQFRVTIGAETKKTLASWHVPTPEELVSILERLAGIANEHS